ncbi:MAG: hypothetical protein KGD63_12580 [Candidatus Lokiarchaeota archaeon]|nr:hypothetical protein [Candidatus Lokiarchaeota archaeon]
MNKIYKKTKENIKNNNFLFIVLIAIRAYGIYFLNKICNYKQEKIRFYKEVGYQLNLKNPKSYNEKIVWKKINDRNPLLPITADKYKVRSYIKKVLGEEKVKEILIPLLYVTDQPETIPFERLPSAFIVKPNHASGLIIIVENGHFNKKEIIKTCRRWLKTTYGLEKLEWAYQPIKRKIIIEKLLRDDDGNIPNDFMFYMFHGKCKLVLVDFDRMNNPSGSYFDKKWDFISVKKPHVLQGPIIQKPKNYEIMLELAEKLAEAFDFVRIDFYNLNGKIYIGELTHYPTSGTTKFEPQSFDFKLGKYWKIKPKYWKKNKKSEY